MLIEKTCSFHVHVIDTARMVSARVCYGMASVCLFDCLSHLSTTAAACGRFAAVGPASRRSIDSSSHRTPSSTAFSSKCEQHHIVSWHTQLNTDLFISVVCCLFAGGYVSSGLGSAYEYSHGGGAMKSTGYAVKAAGPYGGRCQSVFSLFYKCKFNVKLTFLWINCKVFRRR